MDYPERKREKMARNKREQLREFTQEERNWLERISRSQSEPASHVMRAKQLLAVAEGSSYTQAAHLAGLKSGDTTSSLVGRFNRLGLAALQPGHGGGPREKYGQSERERILQEFRREPIPAIDGTATWSVKNLRCIAQSPGWPGGSERRYRSYRFAGTRLQLATIADLV